MCDCLRQRPPPSVSLETAAANPRHSREMTEHAAVKARASLPSWLLLYLPRTRTFPVRAGVSCDGSGFRKQTTNRATRRRSPPGNDEHRSGALHVAYSQRELPRNIGTILPRCGEDGASRRGAKRHTRPRLKASIADRSGRTGYCAHREPTRPRRHGEEQPSAPPRGRDETLGEQLPVQAAAAGADRKPDRYLAAPLDARTSSRFATFTAAQSSKHHDTISTHSARASGGQHVKPPLPR